MSIWRNVKAGITRAFTKEEPERWASVRRDELGHDYDPGLTRAEARELLAEGDGELGTGAELDEVIGMASYGYPEPPSWWRAIDRRSDREIGG
jgi:hypothetical protein